MTIRCRSCRESFPLSSFPHRCPRCGGLYGFASGLPAPFPEVDPAQPGIWRYRAGFGLPEDAPRVTLGEGGTPLVWAETGGKRVGFKMESLNPTGSFKDRGSAVLASWLLAAGVEGAVEDSSGNAGASFAAYANRAGIQARIFIPASASGPKRTQIERFGADLVPIPGPRSAAAQAVLSQVQEGLVYASHAYLPQGTAGIATIAYELVEQLGGAPGTVLMPVGHGSLLLGVSLGFEALLACRLISSLPKLIGIQAAACAPLSRAFRSGERTPAAIQEGITVAEGVAIADPYHGEPVLAAVRRTQGAILTVEEDQIWEGQEELARLGLDVEMTSALVWGGLQALSGEDPGPVICIVTGHGLKNG